MFCFDIWNQSFLSSYYINISQSYLFHLYEQYALQSAFSEFVSWKIKQTLKPIVISETWRVFCIIGGMKNQILIKVVH